MTMMNPVSEVQTMIAALLTAQPWFANHRVEIIEQNKADLKFLLEKQVSALRGVVLVVGCDSMTNQFPNLEMGITVTAVEYVPLNRAGGDWVSAIDAVQAAIEIIDGEWWHFDSMHHETPVDRTLQATATFRGCVKREPHAEIGVDENNEGDNL